MPGSWRKRRWRFCGAPAVSATTHPPRVAMVIHDLDGPGGMERVHTEWLRRAAGSVRFVVISATVPNELRPLVEWRRVRVPRRPLALKLLWFWVMAGWMLFRARCDLVHSAGAIVPNRVDVASVHLCHAGLRVAGGTGATPGLSRLRRLNRSVSGLVALAAERWCFRRGRTLVLAAVSEAIQQQVRRAYPRVPVLIAPNGVDIDRFRPAPEGRVTVRQAERIGSAEIVALFVGGYWDLKGLPIAIQGLAIAQQRTRRSLRLVIVGSGDQARHEALARDCGLGDRVRFLGARSDVERLYQAADMLLLPSKYESFSLVALEAAACGLPVIATRVGCIADVVGANEAGIIIERTAQSVAAAVAQLADDSALRRRMGECGRQRAHAYGWDRSTGRILDIYHALLSTHRSWRKATASLEQRVEGMR